MSRAEGLAWEKDDAAPAGSRRRGVGLDQRGWGKKPRDDIPLAIRRKNGRTLDDLGTELPTLYGWRFDSESALYAALSRREDARYQRAAFMAAARREHDEEEPYTRLIRGTREALRPTRKRRTVKD